MDLLFVVDNSGSMADKQKLLSDAVPSLVRRLANPFCVDINNPEVETQVASDAASCPPGYRREFAPLTDLHIGVITTSLGTAGGDDSDACSTGPGHQPEDDQAHLLGLLDRAVQVPTYDNSGLLAWDPHQEKVPPGESDIDRLDTTFRNLVGLAGESGCGFEQTLESWYRFLVDPNPPLSISVSGSLSVVAGRDDALLAQRKSFLRPDSLLAVVMLTDENDCSLITNGQGWLVGKSSFGGQEFHMPPSVGVCATDPNSPCCRSCALSEVTPPSGCLPLANEPTCQAMASLPREADRLDLRCFHQKQRFGVDLLMPTARYAVGLRSRTLCPDSIYRDADCTCEMARTSAQRLNRPAPACTEKETGKPVPNPIFSNLTSEPAFERDPSQVLLAGILGVPWQDIATPATLNDPAHLEYLSASELEQVDPKLGVNRWQVILGDPLLGVEPLDPYMRESPTPRTGVNPVILAPIAAADSQNPLESPINGHERDTVGFSLQYACTFPLSVAKDCTQTTGAHCDCPDDPTTPSDPVCQPPTGGPGGRIQFFAKAYPGLRELDVLRQHGGSAVVASICPKSLVGGTQDFEFGYRPALSGLVKRMHCASLNAEFDTDPGSSAFGSVDCRLVSLERSDGSCSCGGAGRRALSDEDQRALRVELAQRGSCGGATGVDCATFCGCEIPQTSAGALKACQNDLSEAPVDPATGQSVSGWCYVDPANGFGSPALVRDCPAGNLKNLRLLGSAAPLAEEKLFAICGATCTRDGG
jgi:hypothetical protein